MQDSFLGEKPDSQGWDILSDTGFLNIPGRSEAPIGGRARPLMVYTSSKVRTESIREAHVSWVSKSRKA